MDNLNFWITDKECGPRDSTNIKNNSTSSGNVEVIFKNIKERLIQKILESKIVFGCIAWLTELDILNALSKVQCQIVVQKEDFLRPDSGKYSRNKLRNAYTKLHNPAVFQEMTNFKYSFCSYTEVEAVRCVGNYNREKKPAFPRMHNKFLVFGEWPQNDDPQFQGFIPKEVWTGSFNFTKNAGDSLENAVIISDPIIAKAYHEEFIEILGISEKLDWEYEWIEPDFRLGS
jgi:hypothetical protein